ncbi:MAG: hypothetical protein ACRDRM_06795 [Pseudonocardiaceae bacterium]
MPDIPPYTDLEPWMWRSLLARAAVFHATRTRLSALCDMSRGGAVQGALRDLELWAQECSVQDVDDETIVARVVQQWDAALTRTLGLQQLDAAARDLLTELQTLVRCARGADPFRAIFAGISSLAEALYGSAWRPATLWVAHIRSHPRGGTPPLDPYAVTATTPWPPNETRAAVELQIFCDEFGPAAYAAIPMLLTHECVCHVPARQDRAKNDSAFAEGFLDWAAYFFLDQWAGKLDTAFAPAARRHAGMLQHLLTSRPDTPEGRARLVGHEAAETLLAWFENACCLDPHESRLRVAQLAVQLNQVERPLRDKDHFVSRLGSPIPPDLQAALQDWEAGRTAADTLLSGRGGAAAA